MLTIMGFFKKLKEGFDSAREQVKQNIEEMQEQVMQNVEQAQQRIKEQQTLDKQRMDELMAVNKRNETDNQQDDNDDDDEPRIQLGKLENGILEIREGIKKIDDESLEGYRHLRKIIFPASLEEIEENAIDEQEELEDLDFSRVTKLKDIPNSMVYCETRIRKFIIPKGVTKVGEYFLYEAKAGTEVYVPSSVKEMEAINGNGNNDLIVYLFAHGINIEDMEQDIKTLYVLPEDYGDYDQKLKDCDSGARLREMPEDAMSIYQIAKPEFKPEPQPKIQPEPEPQPESKKEETPVPNGNAIFSARLEALISSALQDGVLTDKERETIKKRAEAEGEDWDEVEMLLDARLEELQSDPSFLASQFLSIKERLDAKRHERVCAEFGSDNFKQLLGEESALKHELERCKLKLAKIGILDDSGDRINYNALPKLNNSTSQSESQPQTTINTPAEVTQPQQSEVHATNVPSRVWNLNMHGQSSVIIPEGVEEIADNTFRWNESLTSITLPSTLKKIGKQVFLGTPLEEIDIPDSVEEIGIRAFEQCKKIKKITLPAKLKEIKEFTFLACDRLKEIDFSRCEELKIIREGAFSGTIIKEFILPDSVTSIEREAFNNCDNVKRVVMPASLENLENNIFSMFERNIKIDFSKVTKLKVIPSYFCGANELTIPQGVTTIEECAFDPERWDSKLFLPPSLKKIEGEGDEDYGNFDEVFVFSPMIEGLFENIGGTIYALPEHIEAYKTYCNAMEYERSIEPMPDEYLYYYDN